MFGVQVNDVFLQGLIEGPSAVPSYHSLDAVDDEVAELPALPPDVQQSRGGSQPPVSSNPVIAMLFQFVTDKSYIGMLIIMMVTFCEIFLLLLYCFYLLIPDDLVARRTSGP